VGFHLLLSVVHLGFHICHHLFSTGLNFFLQFCLVGILHFLHGFQEFHLFHFCGLVL
jgi:hypothetical protein